MSEVFSPTGVRILAGLLAPYLADGGKAESQSDYGVTPEDLHSEAMEILNGKNPYPALSLAVGAWFRSSVDLSEKAKSKMADFLGSLPESERDAKLLLDRWAQEKTKGVIGELPVQVKSSTLGVAATALSMKVKLYGIPFTYKITHPGFRWPLFQGAYRP